MIFYYKVIEVILFLIKNVKVFWNLEKKAVFLMVFSRLEQSPTRSPKYNQIVVVGAAISCRSAQVHPKSKENWINWILYSQRTEIIQAAKFGKSRASNFTDIAKQRAPESHSSLFFAPTDANSTSQDKNVLNTTHWESFYSIF